MTLRDAAANDAAEEDLAETLSRAADARERLPVDVASALAAALGGGRSGPRLYAAALRHAFAMGEQPAIEARQAKQWMLGVDALIEEGDLEDAKKATALLARAFPGTPWLQTWQLVFERLPPADRARAPFRDDTAKALQMSLRPGAKTIVVAFCGVQHRLGTALPVIHRWLARLDAHILYLRDFRNAGFAGGMEGIGDGADATAKHILSLAREAGANRVVTFGNSLGGYAALRYGPLLGADRVLAFIPATTGFDNVPEERREEMLRAGWVDVAALYAAPDAPRARVVFGAQNAVDREAALRLAGLPSVVLEALPEWKSHDVFGALLRADRLDAVFGWLTAADVAIDAAAVLAADADLSDPRPPPLLFRALRRARRALGGRR